VERPTTARPLRLGSAGAPYHVAKLRNERRRIFLGDADRERARPRPIARAPTSMRAIAEHFGVSRTKVSRALKRRVGGRGA